MISSIGSAINRLPLLCRRHDSRAAGAFGRRGGEAFPPSRTPPQLMKLSCWQSPANRAVSELANESAVSRARCQGGTRDVSCLRVACIELAELPRRSCPRSGLARSTPEHTKCGYDGWCVWDQSRLAGAAFENHTRAM